MISRTLVALFAFALARAYAADPVVDRALEDAQKKYPVGDYDRGFSRETAAAHQSDSVFEIHAVSPTLDATKKWYSLTHSDGPPEKVFLDPEILFDQASIKVAWVEHDGEGQPIVLLKFTAAGAEKFGEMTEKLINKRIGIVFQGRLVSAPVIRASIYGGEVTINASDETEAAEMAARLNPDKTK